VGGLGFYVVAQVVAGWVLKCQRCDQLGQREDHMEVFNRQQLGGTPFEPSRSGSPPALGAMAIAAGAVRDLSVAAPIALVDMTTKGCG
jgi:hypothetical protein